MVRSVKIKDKCYEVEDPTQFFLDLFSFRKENKSFFPEDHWELVLGSVVGGMGSGKSTLLQFITALGQKLYGSELRAYHTDSIVSALKKLNENKKDRTKVLFLYLDDALTKPGSDSRRSMGQENVRESQNLSIVRHLLACEDENGVPDQDHRAGFCVIIYAVQDLNRLDAFVRRNLHFTIYKSYYESLEKELDAQSLLFLKEVTEDAIYRHNYSARAYCLMKTLTRSILKLYIPKTEAKIEYLYSDSPSYQEIIDHVMKLDLDDVKDSIVRGYIKEYCSKHKIKLDSSEINEIIEISRYQQWKNGFDAGEEEDDEEIDEDDSEFIANTKKRRSKVSKLQDKNKELTETLKAQNSELKKIKSELKAKEDQEKIIQKQKAKKERQEMIAEKMNIVHTMRKNKTTWADIEDALEVPFSTLRRWYRKWTTIQNVPML